jgi:hypothetical protein
MRGVADEVMQGTQLREWFAFVRDPAERLVSAYREIRKR